jgi:hypothetical protein
MAFQFKRLVAVVVVSIAVWWAYQLGYSAAYDEMRPRNIEQARAFYALVVKSSPAFSKVAVKKVALPDKPWFLEGNVESESDLANLRKSLQPFLTDKGAADVTARVVVKK